MNVIGHAIDAKCNPAEFADDAAEIRVQIGLNLYRNQRRPLTRTEDEMD
jgi:hypothetical protein